MIHGIFPREGLHREGIFLCLCVAVGKIEDPFGHGIIEIFQIFQIFGADFKTGAVPADDDGFFDVRIREAIRYLRVKFLRDAQIRWPP